MLFSVIWRGVEGSDEVVWRECGWVFSVFIQLGVFVIFVRLLDCIKRR